MKDQVLIEAKKLYDMGFAIHWLHKKSKRPIESGWTTGPRKSWKALEDNYRPGMNVGVRLGSPSKIKNNFLTVIDIDVKSSEEKHRKEVVARLRTLIGNTALPQVNSGRGNGSRHYYILTPKPVKPAKLFQSLDTVKVTMPSAAPSKKEMKLLTRKELEAGIRLRAAWEVAIMGDGQQVVLPPSIHPDSGKLYKWALPFKPSLAAAFDSEKISVIKDTLGSVDKSVDNVDKSANEKPGPKSLDKFTPEDIELSWLPIDSKIRGMIETGDGVEDRSAMLLPVARSLIKSGLSINEVLSILTDTKTFMGKAAYEHAKTRDRLKAANWLYRYTVKRAYGESSAAALFEAPIVEAVKQSPEKIKEQQEAFDAEYDYRLDLDRTKNDTLRPTLRNVVLILENEVCEDMVKRDLFSYRDFYTLDSPWGGKEGDAISDDDLTRTKLWLGSNFGFEPPNKIIGEAYSIVAMKNSFDPVVDWVRSIPAWDGNVRLDSWLKKNFQAKGDPEYLAQVFRKWLVAMVARAINPGTKFDWMPIFEGAQGIGKSSFGRILVGDKYFLDNLPDLTNKDAALALQGIWAVEMGELASLRKNEIEIVKGFLTRTIDKVRPPYGERWLEIPRRCVFFGTTNFETYLRDDSGNRRFKPVKVGNLDFEALEQDREQLFAEALWLYETGFESTKTLEITGDAKNYEAEIQADKMVMDDAANMREMLDKFIRNELEKEEVERFDFSRFQINELFEGTSQTFGVSPPLKNWRFDSRNVQFASKALKAVGAENWKSHGMKYWKITNLGTGFL